MLPPAGSTAFPVRGAVIYGQGAGARYGVTAAAGCTRARTCSPRPARRSWPCATCRCSRRRRRRARQLRGAVQPAASETYVYMHMLEPAAVRPGQRLRAGQHVGKVGCTGSCWGDHLHFELRAGRGSQAPVLNPLRCCTGSSVGLGPRAHGLREPRELRVARGEPGEAQVFCASTRSRGRIPSAIWSWLIVPGTSFQTFSVAPSWRGSPGVGNCGSGTSGPAPNQRDVEGLVAARLPALVHLLDLARSPENVPPVT